MMTSLFPSFALADSDLGTLSHDQQNCEAMNWPRGESPGPATQEGNLGLPLLCH